MDGNYYLGLDMGTSSCGWSVTDEEYHVLRRHGKALWGVRLFEGAKTAEERRMHRTGRRRLDRRGWRINILQELFAEEVSKIDPGFFLRMKESKYYPEDKRDINGERPELPYALFVDPEFTDKDYHRKFPTIYHLRKWLMETKEVPDVRLVYLALHHMMKHRGHFLLSGDIEQVKEFKNTFETFIQNVKDEELDFNLEITEEKISYIEEVLSNKNILKSTKKSRLVKELGARTKCEKAVITLLTGGTAKLSDIFANEELDENERPKISFADNGYDEYIDSVEAELGEQFYIIASAKAVYDWSVLTDILDRCTSISEAKIKVYEKHKADLRLLKEVVRENFSKDIYKKIFVVSDAKLANYPAYIGMTKVNGKKTALGGKQCSREDFLKYLNKTIVEKLPESEEKTYLKNEIETDQFLPRQVTKDNGVLPYQIHKYELQKILDNLSARIPVIAENKEKLIQLFTFRIPYYVGPLNKVKEENEQKYTWAVRKSEDKIYPWNFTDIIDVEASAEKFIKRMTNKCTYLIGEDVLPKDSLLYSKYRVLNELNNVRLDGKEISVELKQKIYEGVFCKRRKVRQKDLKNFLLREGIAERDVDITGIDGDFKASLTAYHDFKEKLSGIDLKQSEKEEIIQNIVLFGDDKKLLKQRLGKLFPKLTDKQKSSIAALSYHGWGRFSKKFLEEITIPAPETGEVWNLITALWETNENLSQLLGKKYQFSDQIKEYNEEQNNPTLSYKTVEEQYVSPAVKRQIWQTLQVIKEIKKVMGKEPERIFVEMARESQESKRTESRKKQLIDLYKVCKEEEKEIYEKLEKHEEHQFRSDKLYLYYTQKCQCMYCNKPIEIQDFWDNYKCNIDHIYPQSKTMDDSLNNRVLVHQKCNEDKGDRYPISYTIQKERGGFWKSLLDGNFITKEKYERLVRKTELTSDELAGFIERQIVETRQSTKVVADLLKKVMPDSEIVYVKARSVSKFRQDYDFVKVRDMNDLHHAKDAYLNIVVGNAYYTKFTKNAVWFIKENPGRSYNLEKMFIHDIFRNGKVAWKAGDKGTIKTVRNVMNKNNILVTRRSYEVKGGLFDQQIMKKGKGQVPIKTSDERLHDINKYGGYNKAAGAYFMLVKSTDAKGNEQRTIEFVPIYKKDYIEQSEENALEYLCEIMKDRKLLNPIILINKIKIDTLFKVDGFYMWLSGRTGKQLIFKGANELLLSDEETKILKKVIKFINRKIENKNVKIVAFDGINEAELTHLYDVFVSKLQNTIYKIRLGLQASTLIDNKGKFEKLSLEDKCTVLAEILHLFQCQSTMANLTLISGPAKAGSIKINNNITKCKQISIINQSVTGIYEKEIDLLKL